MPWCRPPFRSFLPCSSILPCGRALISHVSTPEKPWENHNSGLGSQSKGDTLHGNLEAVNGGASLAAGVGSAFQSPLEIFWEGAAAGGGQAAYSGTRGKKRRKAVESEGSWWGVFFREFWVSESEVPGLLEDILGEKRFHCCKKLEGAPLLPFQERAETGSSSSWRTQVWILPSSRF